MFDAFNIPEPCAEENIPSFQDWGKVIFLRLDSFW